MTRQLTSATPWTFDSRKECIVDRYGNRVMYRSMPFSGSNADVDSAEGITARANTHLFTTAGRMRDLLEQFAATTNSKEVNLVRRRVLEFLEQLQARETEIAHTRR